LSGHKHGGASWRCRDDIAGAGVLRHPGKAQNLPLESIKITRNKNRGSI
jgi:hypothetical protein